MDDDVFLVFDLDDTLYPEHAYARSALHFAGQEIARRFGIADPALELIDAFEAGEDDAIGACLRRNDLPADAKAGLVSAMQGHVPAIALRDDAARVLASLRAARRDYAILTDGRATTQRRKIAALGCDDAAFVSVSEECGLTKTDAKRWIALEATVGGSRFCYIGDNPAKDFLLPKLLGWDTVMLKSDEKNVHAQDLPADERYHPHRTVTSLDELL
jgi:putative hydrolase of the HAD superfamily